MITDTWIRKHLIFLRFLCFESKRWNQSTLRSYYDFSNCFHYFARKMSKQRLCQYEDTVSIHEYITQWIKTKDVGITNLSTLSQT